MDTEEIKEISHHRKHGRPETTRGPYYHKTWWESYKGAVKGILGGLIVGGLVGAAIGGGVLGVLAVAGVEMTGAVIGGVMASATLFGMIEGKEKFEKVGIATGAVAASSELSEMRMKMWMRDRLTGLANEIRELKAVVKGSLSKDKMHDAPIEKDRAPIFDDNDFRTTHCEECPTKSGSYFPKVGAIGAMVGAATAAVFGFSKMGEHVLGDVLGKGVAEGIAAGGVETMALIATGAIVGASFGINRDIFRKIFDVTDYWFMGLTSAKGKAKSHEVEPEVAQAVATAKPEAIAAKPPAVEIAATVPVVEAGSRSSTHFQDKINAAAAKQALLSMDHTTAIRH